MMKIYQLSQPQKILGIALLAVTAGLSVLLVLATRESAAQLAASENVIVTREVKLQLPINSATTSEINLPREKAKVGEQSAVVQADAKSIAQPTTSGSWKMGSLKTPTPKISLSEQISSYAIVELEQIPEVLPVEGQQIALPMLNGQTIIANVQSVVTNPNGDYTWSGHLQGYGDDYPIVMTYGERSIFATITTPEGSYTMESLDGLGWLYKNPAEIELSSPGANDFLEVNAIQ
ncbi:MAG: hypothetical protein EOO52_03045 [Gammaproteobacteria bacterium]|nr:MAG: hypothetical protein EOO52_03045 [Gammaproteobacteria bacterium]